MKKSLFISIIFFFITSCNSSKQIKNDGETLSKTKITNQDIQTMLEHHNKVRKEVGAPPLVWNNRLTDIAQAWANHLASNGCKMKHSSNKNDKGESLGENLFWGSSNMYKPLDASLAWYSEKKIYTYHPTDNDYQKTGHYTQMVWKDTKEMGVGIAYCQNGGIIIIANYYPAGNYVGKYPY